MEVAGDSRMRCFTTVLLFDTFHRKMIFSPACATNSGGRRMVVMPYQLNPNGTIRTTGGLFEMSGGEVRNGLKVTEPVMGSP